MRAVVDMSGELPKGTVHVWWATVGDVRPHHRHLLGEQERERLAQLRRDGDAARFVMGCALIRLAVSRYTDIAPRDVPVVRECDGCGGPHGKPRAAVGESLELSLSHSGEHIALAVARETPLGIDVESDDGTIDLPGLAPRVLSPMEAPGYAELAESARRRRVLSVWTCKEAALKATGDGLRFPMNRLGVEDPEGTPRLTHWEGRPWLAEEMRLARLDAPAGYAAVLAVLGPPGFAVLHGEFAGLSRAGAAHERAARPAATSRAASVRSATLFTLPTPARGSA
ncbi:4'-phosphopantetheinyl transferase family protein [Streptomyces sp. NPDC049627]|uniref:4'-phosphopantetheinyl transferase family protein n=1 Tax=Streptomyces sp. NPDC049627 TaxID=3365595 RepID=UPI0037958DA1